MKASPTPLAAAEAVQQQVDMGPGREAVKGEGEAAAARGTLHCGARASRQHVSTE